MTGRAILEAARRDRLGFLTAADVRALASDPITRLELVLVRCGRCRFLAPVQDADHLIGILSREGSDYVRDVSIPTGALQRSSV